MSEQNKLNLRLALISALTENNKQGGNVGTQLVVLTDLISELIASKPQGLAAEACLALVVKMIMDSHRLEGQWATNPLTDPE